MRLEAKKYLYDIKQAGDLLGAFTDGKRFADYEHDAMLRAAVEREFEIIGGAPGDWARQHWHQWTPWRNGATAVDLVVASAIPVFGSPRPGRCSMRLEAIMPGEARRPDAAIAANLKELRYG